MIAHRRLLSALALTALAAVAPAPAGAADVKRPKAGQYIGETEKNVELTLYVTGKRARVDLDCGPGAARVSVRGVKLHRTPRGYTFGVHNRRADVTGRFARTGTKARGEARLKSKLCSSRAPASWTARHVKRPVKAPSGQYGGKTDEQRDITLLASGRSIELASFAFACGAGEGRTNLNSVALRRTRHGYAFSIKSNGSVTYSDGQPDENAEVDLFGRFNPAASRAQGLIRVNSPHCGSTGQVPFVVTRVKSG
ncbi:MAG: hypothetical protein QOG63_1956 [Thermoleophilaceae bacterium]|nr:hypothetical protein [Thermoleophilaceae bacterium]